MFANEVLQHQVVLNLGWTLVHFLWQGAIVGAVVAILLAAMRGRTASARYMVGIAALFVMGLGPVITMAALMLNPAPGPTERLSSPSPHVVESPSVAAAESSYVVTTPVETTETAGTIEQTALVATPSLSESVTSFTPWIAIIWFVGAALLSIRLLLSWFQVVRITRLGLKPVDQDIQRLFDVLCERLGLRCVVGVFESTLVAVPATVGWLKPVVLLPATAITGLTREQLVAVLAHELAHVRRYDYVVNLCQGVIETLLFYHPAIWLLSRYIRRERENCCDDVAIGLTGEPVDYARALTQLAEFPPVPKLATAANGGELKARVRRLLGRPSAAGSNPPRTAGLVCLIALVLVSVAITTSAAPIGEQSEERLYGTVDGKTFPIFVFAKHVIFRNGRIVDFDSALKELEELHKAGTPGLSVHFTEGLTGKRQERFNQFVFVRRLPVAYVEPMHGDRYDRVRTKDDFKSDPALAARGTVLGSDGAPVAGATVVVLPYKKARFVSKTRVWFNGDGELSYPGLYEVARTDERGQFQIHPGTSDYFLIASHESGVVSTVVGESEEPTLLRLEKWSRLGGRVITSPETKERLQLWSTPTDGLLVCVDVPFDASGRFTLKRLVPGKQRVVRSSNQSTVSSDKVITLKPDEGQTVFLRPLSRAKLAKIHNRDRDAELSMDVDVGDPEPATFESFNRARFDQLRNSWRPVLLEFAAPNDAESQAIRKRVFNHEYVIDSLEENRFALMTVDPESDVGKAIIEEYVGEGADTPRYALFPRSRYQDPQTIWEPHRRNMDFLRVVESAGKPPAAKPLPLVIAKHTLIFENEVVAWKQYVARASELARSQNVSLDFHYTEAGSKREAEFDKKRKELRQELNTWGMHTATLGPRASNRLDDVRSSADLVRDGREINGQIVTPNGDAATQPTQILMLPDDQKVTVSLKGPALRYPLEENTVRALDGRFTFKVSDESTVFVFLSDQGYSYQSYDQLVKSDNAIVQLNEWATVSGEIDGIGFTQTVTISSQLVGTQVSFSDSLTVPSRAKFRHRVIPGKVRVGRSVTTGNGLSSGFSVETANIDPGDSHAVPDAKIPQGVLQKIMDYHAQQRAERESRRVKRQSKKK